MTPLGSIAAALPGVVVEDAHAEVRGPASPGSAHRDRGPADFRGHHSVALHPLPVRAVSPPPKAGSLASLSRLRRILEKTIMYKSVRTQNRLRLGNNLGAMWLQLTFAVCLGVAS